MGSELLGEEVSQGKRGVGDSEDEDKPTLSYTEIFYRCLPQYLVMGMSADEFWNCDPRMYGVYREKDRLENERKNELLWIAGAYVMNAIGACLSPDDSARYPSKPFELNLHVEDEDDEEEEPTVEEIQKSPDFIHVMDWAMTVNKNIKGNNDGR